VGAIDLLIVGPVEDDVVEFLDGFLRRTFGYETRRMASLPNPDFARDPRRAQYDSTRILREALNQASVDAIQVLAVTGVDLFIPMLSFVYGQAQLKGRGALLSLARLRQEFYGLPPDRPLLYSRAAKEALHELGHSFGLVHCPVPSCAMSLSSNILQIDAKNSEYCPGCNALVVETLTTVRVRAALPQHEEDRP
jgi:archaemetzincin